MSDVITEDYGVVAEDATLTIERMLPGPIDRAWSYIVDSELRRKWLAAGSMEQHVGAAVELVWRNDELACPLGNRPEGVSTEHRMECEVLAIDAPHMLKISWGSTGGVTFNLEERGSEVLLTLTHHRVEDPTVLNNVSAGWHAHLGVLEAELRGTAAKPFWDEWTRLKAIYKDRVPV